MNTKTKRRLVVVSGIIIISLIITLAVVGGNSAATTLSVFSAVEENHEGQKVQVSGNVVANSFETKNNTLTFAIYDPDPEGDITKHLNISFEGGVSASFGNDVTAICTGKIGEDGVLYASELVTKCPSKYEDATDALEVARLLEYGEGVYDKPVKVTGIVKEGSLKSAGGEERLVLVDSEGTEEISVKYSDALSDEVQEGSVLVLTGSLSSDKKFVATDVALEG